MVFYETENEKGVSPAERRGRRVPGAFREPLL